MKERNRGTVEERVVAAAEDALERRGHASMVDVLLGMRWLETTSLRRWQQGQIASLEEAMQVSPGKVRAALKQFSVWADRRALRGEETRYQTREQQPLRFSTDGNPSLEGSYRTHWFSESLPPKKKERLTEKLNKPPETVVVIPSKDWTCHSCGKTGRGWLVMENAGPSCLECIGLGDLEFLPAGEAGLTRRAKAASARSAVVVKWARARKHYERQGIMVEAAALAEARRRLGIDEP